MGLLPLDLTQPKAAEFSGSVAKTASLALTHAAPNVGLQIPIGSESRIYDFYQFIASAVGVYQALEIFSPADFWLKRSAYARTAVSAGTRRSPKSTL
ncbi:hypothetical protein [Aestuariicoccus sp. MJ-SS9]|uniref:hypothetical protein n=1 Tax=Aestuariicoccus sp. MJ-SS9 TaxID=3079855 RepID=UPI0029136593|nr:hypothetical protein [Aestuariicoccus sp. MJ-SS9]MDU8913607.1 hypothetical protein [Aestuariicoccus sp. MJ-SS9]